MNKKNATRSAVALNPAASWVSSSSSCFSTPTKCDMISRIHVKARWLIRMLAWVRATLDDAEDMNITEESIRDWLRELQEVADAAEDLLDEFPPEALRLGFVGGGGWTAGCITELPRQRKRASEMTMLHDQRMEDIVSRFMEIKKPEQALTLDCCRGEQVHAESISATRTTSSAIEEPRIVGRDKDLAEIKQFLLSSDAEESRASDDTDDHVPVLAIVGMGGLGKTTLAQLAYNDSLVNHHFQLKSWVCVSEDFDVIQLTKAMLQSLNVEAGGLSELDPLQRKLLQKLEGQGRLLLVLDDVWEADNLNIHSWNLLTVPLRNSSADTKIIITTRSRKVSEMVSRNSTYDLAFLSDEDTLELFMLHAFEGRDPNSYLNLVAIGKETARKCKGVPLAAKTLGGLLRTKDGEEWNKILESEVWDTTINQEDSIIPILRLSYRHLPAPLKRCFKYCSLFPKDWVFDRNQIICMWMAQGYVKTSRRELMEDIGQRYIDNLLSRSFFQTCLSSPKIFHMHNLMHDLARCVSVYECHSMAGSKSSFIPRNIRHLSIIPTTDSQGTIIPSIKDIPKRNLFRSFLLPGMSLYLSFFEHELPSDSYTRMEHLRVLDLGGVGPCRLPESIARLKHLRYLRISTLVGELPEFVGSMHHLQTLDLEGLYKLPNSMSNLHNLRHINLGSDAIEYPVGIGKLTDLQTLPGFRVSPKDDCAKLGELKDMNNIRGEFAIKGLENLASVNEAKKASLNKKRNISYLHLERDHEADSSPIDEEVLESLKPSVKLRSLKISGFKGPSYPSWLGDLSFSRLHTIELEHCGNWASLPPLGQLPSLKSLYISEAGAMEYIGGEFFSGGFPQLEELTLEGVYNWKSWCGAQEGDCPKLKKLSISSCENLESLSLINLGAVEVLSISECPELRFLPGDSLELSHLQRVQKITIQGIYQVWCIEAAHFSTAAPLEDQPRLYLQGVGQREVEYMLGMCSSICRLTVTWCWDLTSLPLGNLSALEYVEISECPQLRITSVYPQLQQLPSLKKIHVHRIHDAEIIAVLFEESHLELENVDQLVASFLLKDLSHMICLLTITRCANLTSLPLTELTALKYLQITGCNQLQLSSGSLQLPQSSSMLEMKIKCICGAEYIRVLFAPGGTEALETSCLELTNVDQLVASFLLKELSHMICRLTITQCANLTSLPLTELTALKYLEITGCNQLQLLSGSLQLPQSSSMLEMKIKCIRGAEYVRILFSPGGTVALETSCLELTNVDQLVASFLLKELSHKICRLTITQCANLTSLPLTELTALKYLEITGCNQLQLSSGSLQLPQSSSMLKMKIKCIRGAEYVHVLFSPGGSEALVTSCLELTNVDKLEALFLLNHEFSHMIHRLTITSCANLTSLPLTELTALKYLKISECYQLQLSSGSLLLPQSSSMLEIRIQCICGEEYIRVLFSRGGTEVLEPCLELTNVDKLEALFLLNEFSHMIRRLTITRCANLTSLPWTDLTTLEYLTVSECSMFQLLDAKQLPSTLQVLCIYGNPYVTEQCSRHQYFQRLKQVQQCSDKEGGERNLYLVFRNVHLVGAALNFCEIGFTKIHTLDIGWDCCTNDRSNVTDTVTQEGLFNLYLSYFSCKKLVIRRYTGSGFASWYADFFSKELRTDFFRRLSSVSLLQCSKCEILPPLSQLYSLKELFVGGASSLESFMQDRDDMSIQGRQQTRTDIAFPGLQKLEFHDMPVWKEWLGTREGDFPRLRKLILKHCPKLRALPHLPSSLEELELEACDELTSLSASDSPNRTKSLRSSKPFSRLSLSTSKGTSPMLQHMSLTNCPLLLAWCKGNPRILADIPNLLIDGVRVHTSGGNSIRSQIRRIRMKRRVPRA